MNNRRWNVAVLMGGPSAEREVSLRSGSAVVGALSQADMNVTAVDVRGPQFVLPDQTDVVFIALHGTFGEDGGVQQILEARGLPYTGSGIQASALAFDKAASKGIFEAHDVSTPRGITLTRGDPIASVLGAMALPVVVKPARQGSSVGVHRVSHHAELEEACRDAWKYDEQIVIEEFVAGRELTVSLFDGRALPVVEVKPRDGFFSYDAKYTKGQTEYLVPAPLAPSEALRAQELALQAHAALGCRDYSRVDLIMGGDGRMVVLEVNTIPGFTETSLMPKAAREAGLDFKTLCVRLVEMALARGSAAAEGFDGTMPFAAMNPGVTIAASIG
jgi:D-alanine-D-alanine ligase